MKESLLNQKLKLNDSKQLKFVLSNNNNNKQPFKLKHNTKLTQKPQITSISENSRFNSKLSLRKQNTLSITKVSHLPKDKKDPSLLPKIHTNNLEFIDPLELSFGNAFNKKTFYKMKTHVDKSNKKLTTAETNINYDYGRIKTTEYTDNITHNTDENTNDINTGIIKDIKRPTDKQFLKIKTFTHKSRKTNVSFHKKFPTVKHSTNQIGSYIKSFAVNSFTGNNKQNNNDKVSIILSIVNLKIIFH